MGREKFDLENFPWSDSAKRMLSYVTAGFYDESYVGKWIYQVMGAEYDKAMEMASALPEQFFVESATWGLRYHEIKWQLPVREDLPYDERRRRIYLKQKFRAPMAPYNMERYLEVITGPGVHIADVNDPGEYGFAAPHPNIFKAYFILGEETRDLMPVYRTLNSLKQSHTTYSVEFDCNMGTNIKAAAGSGMAHVIKVKARTARKIEASAKDRATPALFLSQNILVKTNDVIGENDVYVVSEDGKKVRVLADNGTIVSI